MSNQIIINEEIYKKLKAALIITGEDEENVLNNLIGKYVRGVFESILGKRETAVTNVENQVAVSDISENEQKQLFLNWFRGLTRNGKPYNPITISGYTGRIENACSNPAFSSVPVKNLFTITDIAEFLKIQKQIKNCAGYIEFDAQSHSGFTAALKKYEEFLRFQNGVVSVNATPPAVVPSYSQSSSVHHWTMEEDEICCKKFLEYYVIGQSNLDVSQFLQIIAKDLPAISPGSLRMKIQNVRFLAVRAGLKDTSNIMWLSQYSKQNEKAFEKALSDLGLKKQLN